MVDDRLGDGTRIAQLLASEVTGGVGPLAAAAVVDVDSDVEATTDGRFAYGVSIPAGDDDSEDGGDRVAAVYVLPDRARVEIERGREAAATAAAAADLRVRRHPGPPARVLVFVPSGAAVKAAADALAAAVDASTVPVDGEHPRGD
jgi:hypothetical protein